MDRERPDEIEPEKDSDKEVDLVYDEYTYEMEPEAPDGEKFIEIVPREPEEEDFISEEETAIETYALDAQAEAASDIAASYTEDEEIAEDFAERQNLYSSGREELRELLDEHTSLSPDLSGGDVDAAWEDTDVSGEESVGGTVATPDQDIVDEIGEAVGIKYDDDEPLNTEEKLRQRDRERWELDPRSSDDDNEDLKSDEGR